MSTITEAEDPKSAFKQLPRQRVLNVKDGKLVGGAYLRRILGKRMINGVYVWHNYQGRFGADQGILQIDIQGYGVVRQEWASFEHLKDQVTSTRWRNLVGAPLFINGVPAGKVGAVTEAKKKKAVKKPVAPPKPDLSDPKTFFKQKIATNELESAEVREILQYMSEEFQKAYRDGTYARWRNDDMSGDWWPSYDDDNDDQENPESNPWTQVMYYFEYETVDHILFLLVMECDRDGNHDAVEDCDVNDARFKKLMEEYGWKGYAAAMKRYWEWVQARGRDPLHYVNVPIKEVERKWIAGFVREGDRLRLFGMRQILQTPPSPPMLPRDEAIAKGVTDNDWTKALAYCLLDENGYTTATEQEIIGDGGKLDNYGRLIIKFSWTDKEDAENSAEVIRRVATDALAQLGNEG